MVSALFVLEGMKPADKLALQAVVDFLQSNTEEEIVEAVGVCRRKACFDKPGAKESKKKDKIIFVVDPTFMVDFMDGETGRKESLKKLMVRTLKAAGGSASRGQDLARTMSAWCNGTSVEASDSAAYMSRCWAPPLGCMAKGGWRHSRSSCPASLGG